ncbi:MAG: acetolactate synthase large subunit [Gammaproteobacteria bacterium]|nr:acetolactate synthase large subunit [Gammaproteobacteria bacterium]NIR97503.1 acetolactate synthase large subunit [Gammaproteobacteria bacterium]NIT63141.1 acetolactate synthase large subunit [Gammaproteobacteria bacterium]NIV19260.1 acetolactate synthase large subunit [Gammaproteobacteria bacterium]NIX10250.1 acetolactate synthase large subunit [Gammaproteobacteria bacterium]
MKAAQLFIQCLENEGVDYVFGVPGEENLDIMDALVDSAVRFVPTRHEQGAAFMADVYGRLTGRAAVCLSTLGPGATNLLTGVADANMDHAPLVAIAGQAGTNRLHKESHQVLDLEEMFRLVTKYSSRIMMPTIIPEVVRKAFKLAQFDKSGACFIEFPENIAKMEVDDHPLPVNHPHPPEPPADRVVHAVRLISEARYPIILAGNGVVRGGACRELAGFAERLNIPVANTFMAKGAIPFKHPMALGSAGLQAHDYVNCGFDHADLIVCVGYDLVEYHPYLWHPTRDRKIIHIDMSPAEVDECYAVECGVVGDIRHSLVRIGELATPHEGHFMRPLREALKEEMAAHAEDLSFPVRPQKLIWDLRTAMGLEDVAICDVGAHKMWMARMFRCEHPNTCIISNGFASMGIALPGAIGAKLVHADRAVVAVTGDGGFMMNAQELETAVRMNTPLVILIWNDGGYGLIEWKQMNDFGRKAYVDFANPDFVKFAESFGARGYRIDRTDALLPTLREALASEAVCVIDCPVDYGENLKLTEKLGEMVCPI